MLAKIVTTEKELSQIIELSRQNAKSAVSAEDKISEGFISWTYTPDLLRELHLLQPSVIVKDDDNLAGYALVALKQSADFHNDLKALIQHLDQLVYGNKSLGYYRYYVMGQICVDKKYRGKGVFEMLYQKHKELFETKFDFVITEISPTNTRSLRAHEKVGFKTIHTYSDAMDDWEVVLWDWK